MDADLDALQEFADRAFATMVLRHHGSDGTTVLRSVLLAVRRMYEHIDLERVRDPIVVFQMVDPKHTAPCSEAGQLVPNPTNLASMADRGLCLEVTASGRWFTRPVQSVDPQELAQLAVVYLREEGAEWFLSKKEKSPVPAVQGPGQSIFAVPTFTRLVEALGHYADTRIRTSQCPIFSGSWQDERRLFFRSGPEDIIRDSLADFLRITLRNKVEVGREQNINATRPIDVRVTFALTSKIALIEIKWLGKSRDDKGNITAAHGPHRARQGAKQLSDYLDLNHQERPHQIARGYLVVIDGRRYGLKKDSAAIPRREGMHYAGREIIYSPAYHETRTDFEYPLRMFAEPLCD